MEKGNFLAALEQSGYYKISSYKYASYFVDSSVPALISASQDYEHRKQMVLQEEARVEALAAKKLIEEQELAANKLIQEQKKQEAYERTKIEREASEANRIEANNREVALLKSKNTDKQSHKKQLREAEKAKKLLNKV